MELFFGCWARGGAKGWFRACVCSSYSIAGSLKPPAGVKVAEARNIFEYESDGCPRGKS